MCVCMDTCLETGLFMRLQMIINDHDKECTCYQRIISEYPTVNKRRDHEVK